MKWKKFTLTTTTEAVDLISYTLDELGIEGIEIEDNIPLTEKETKGMFIDILPELPPDEGVAKVSFYLDENDDIPAMMAKVKEALGELKPFTDLGACTFAESETEDKDWINNWKQYFHPIKIGERLLIRPTWEDEYDAEGRAVLHLEPGLAFGTGSHETTRLCLEALEKNIKGGEKVLDVGCGSGILAIASLLLGAESATGVDIDELAVKTAEENGKMNGFGSDRLTFIHGDLADKVSGKFDIVVANIVADVIIMFCKTVPEFMADNAVFITSGIIDIREQEVVGAFAENGFEIIARHADGGWRCFECRRKK